jgi:hypothetical protein
MAEPDPHVHEALVRATARAWGISLGLLLGLGVFVATNVLVLKGGENVGMHLGHLSSVFPGYDVTFGGSLIGFVYAFVVGYALGRLLAPRRPVERDHLARSRGKHLRLNGNGWGVTLGGVLALGLFGATNALVVKGGENVGELLSYLAVYLPGYAVTFAGSLVGAAWLFAWGWLAGQLIGRIYNRTVARAEG